MDNFLSTKEVAALLQINEKMVYSLVADKGLPATKVTGKWLFPKHLVEQWVENHTLNLAQSGKPPVFPSNLLVVAGSNDILLDRVLNIFNKQSDTLAVFANIGSMGGLHALRKNICHIAASHLMEEDGKEYNFTTAKQELDTEPVVVNFCRRQQGLLIARGNPKRIFTVKDLQHPGIRLVNRHLGTGTRLLLDAELSRAAIEPASITGYDREVSRHLDVGLEILAGRADAGPGIEAVAGLLNLDFIPLCWERFDFLVNKSLFFEKHIQDFLSLLHGEELRKLAADTKGYDLGIAGMMVYKGHAPGDRPPEFGSL